MGDVVAVQNGQLNGTSNAIIGTQRRTFCLQPFAINIGLDCIVVKIEFDIHQLVTNHIHVALQNGCAHVLHSFRSGFTD